MISGVYQRRLIQFDPRGSYVGQRGLRPRDVAALAPRLTEIRDEILRAASAQESSELETGRASRPACQRWTIGWPDEAVEEYQCRRSASLIARVLSSARRLQRLVDRIVVLGSGNACAGIRALMSACCEPYFNELSRAQRGGRPRVYFAGDTLDNDRTQGLLHLLNDRANSAAGRPDESSRWGAIAIGDNLASLAALPAMRPFFAALDNDCQRRGERTEDFLVAITREPAPSTAAPDTAGCRDHFTIPGDVDDIDAVLTTVGLVPAAILGLDVVAILRGAAAMTAHFRAAPAGANAVLDWVAINHLLEARHEVAAHALVVWSESLEAAASWYKRLHANRATGRATVTMVGSRDWSGDVTGAQRARNTVFYNLAVDSWHEDALTVEAALGSENASDQRRPRTFPELTAAACVDAVAACAAADCPTTTIRFPRADEFCLGQFFQMMILAMMVDERLASTASGDVANARAASRP